MNKTLKKLLSSTLLLSALVLSGCGSTTKVIEKVAISYVANETSVYSSTAEVVNAVADSVVEISTESTSTAWGRQYIVSGAGSGVIVSKSNNDYYVITNDHVISGANEITVKTREGTSYNASLIASDDSEDIGIVKITTNDELKLATWGNSDSLQVGEDLIAIGNPLGSLGGTVTKGILSAKGRTITVSNYAMTLLQTDTAINPGNSGGGLFNMRGQLIGIVNAKKADEEIEGICFAIPEKKARVAYENLMENGYLKGRASFNIEPIEGSISSGGTSKDIIYLNAVGSVEENTFQRYDMIYSINGELITTLLSYNIALSHLSVGQSVEVKVYRGSYSGGMWGGISFSNTLTTFNATTVQYGQN